MRYAARPVFRFRSLSFGLAVIGHLWAGAHGAAALTAPIGVPHVDNTAALEALASTTNPIVVRDGVAAPGDAPQQTYRSSTSPCPLGSPAGTGDGGSQVKSADGNCWLAVFPAEGADAREFGVKPDGTTDNGTTLANAVAWAVAMHGCLLLPPGSMAFTTTLAWSPSGGRNFCIKGTGPQSVLLYTGTNTMNDLIDIGTISGPPSKALTFADFRVASNTRMTGGAGLHFMHVGQSTLRGVIADGQNGNGNLWNGEWFDQIDSVHSYEGQATGQNVGLQVNGGIGSSRPKADLWLIGGKYTPATGTTTAIGILIGGAFGGFHCLTDVIGNNINLQIDDSLAAESNREIFLEGACTVDSAATGQNILANDTMKGGGMLVIAGWVASAATIGIDIQAWPNGTVSISAPKIFNNAVDGILVEDATSAVSISSGVQIFSNGNGSTTHGYGVDCTDPTDNIYSGAEPLGNHLGSWAPNCHIENLDPANGYRKGPDGMIDEWFSASFTGAANSMLSPSGGNPFHLPLAFPHGGFQSTVACNANGFSNGVAQMTIAGQLASPSMFNLFLESSVPVRTPQVVSCRLRGN